MAKTGNKKLVSARGSWFSSMLDLRCPACGTKTSSALLWRCSRCGYPSSRKIRCPNCGRQAARTRDWACQWCGYPLTSPLYKELTVDFAPLLSESMARVKQEEQASAETFTGTPTAASSAVPQATTKVPVSSNPNNETPSLPVPEPAPPSEKQPVKDVKAEPRPLKEPEPPVSDEEIAVTIEEIQRDFDTDANHANTTYHRRMLKVKGIVTETISGEGDAIPVLVLGGADTARKTLRCIFDKRYSAVVKRLLVGQRVAVLGRYEATDGNITLTDCMLVG
ncbi:MAG: hypothetical protein Q8O43_00805 [Dehalococcoidia bacterium]|nr:hypothetical protein [Dehalococcoidia bacterium]